MRYLFLFFIVGFLLACSTPQKKVNNSSVTSNTAMRSPQQTAVLPTAALSSTALSADSAGNLQEEFKIEVFRRNTTGNLVTGTIGVNGQSIGPTYENDELKINSGTYPGYLRYVSSKGHVQGSDGYIGDTGDFLLEIGNVTWSDGTKRTSLLFHGGNKADQSQGCIMLGPVSRDAAGNRVLPPDHALRKLRTLFYGTNDPVSSPNKRISITIH